MQQQQHADYDLLAVFNDESKAEAAELKLRKEGFDAEEVHRLEGSIAEAGQFREHGPNRERSSIFLQTRRTGPNPRVILLLAVVLGLVLTAVSFAASFALPALPRLPVILIGAAIGIILGVLLGVLRRGRVQGAIGQDLAKTGPPPPAASKATKSARTVVAIRLPDPENVSRRSRARAILLNNGGKIDRSVGRRE